MTKVDIYQLLNLQHIGAREVLQETKAYEIISAFLNGAMPVLAPFYIQRSFHGAALAELTVYCDDEALLKPDLAQNETAAYLCGGIFGFVGLLYGPIVIECFSKQSKERMSRWIGRMDAGYLQEWFDRQLGDDVLKELWASDTYEKDHPLKATLKASRGGGDDDEDTEISSDDSSSTDDDEHRRTEAIVVPDPPAQPQKQHRSSKRSLEAPPPPVAKTSKRMK